MEPPSCISIDGIEPLSDTSSSGKLNQYHLSTYLLACESSLDWFIFLNAQIILMYFMDKKIVFIETVHFINRKGPDIS